MWQGLYFFSQNYLNSFGLMFLHDIYLINHIPSPLLQNQSPFFLRFGHNPDLDDFKVFGYLCYASTLQVHRTKLDS